MKFRMGDRVVATNDGFLKAGVGTVTSVHEEQGAYGVLFDKDEHRGPLGSGAMWMFEKEIESIEEEKKMKKAVLTRNPDYYLSYDVGEEMTLVAEKGYNMEYGAIEYLFVNDADIEQSVMGGDFRWIDEEERTSIEVGDKVRIEDVSSVVLSEIYFRDGDITEVVAEHSRGGMYIEIPQKSAHPDSERMHGVPVLYITKTERENFFEKVSETHWEDDQSRIAELEAEVAELKEQLSAALRILKGAL